MPPTRQQMRGPTSERQRTPHLDAGTTKASARTKHLNGVRTGQLHPAANHAVELQGQWFARYSHGTQP